MSFTLPDLGEDFSMLGHWWLPTAPQEEVAGILSSAGGRMRLKLFGALPGVNPNDTYTKVAAIHGAAEAKAVTLVNCVQTGFGLKMPGTIEQTFLPWLGYIGNHIADPGNLFRDWSATLTHLGPWLGKEPVLESFQTTSEGKLIVISHVHERNAPDCYGVAAQSFELRFSHSLSTANEAFRSKAFKYSALLTIHPDAAHPAEWFQQQHERIYELMTLLIGDSAPARRVYGTDGWSSGRPEHYEVRFDHAPPEGDKELHPSEVLVPMPAISAQFADIVEAFLRDYEKIHESVSLILSAVHDRYLGSHVRLLLLCQALECLHRNLFGGQYLDKSGYEPIRAALTTAIPVGTDSSLREALKKRIEFGYQYSLFKRLRELLRFVGHDIVGKIGITDPEEFARDAKDARNFYTHWDASGSPSVPKGAALANVVSKLGAFSQVVVLKHLGVDPNLVVKRMLDYQPRYLQEYKALQ